MMLLAPLLLSLGIGALARKGHPAVPAGQHACYDLVSPFSTELKAVDCLSGKALLRRRPQTIGAAGTAPVPSTTSSGLPPLPSSSAAPAGLSFTFNCTSANGPDTFCSRAQSVFENAGAIISSVFALRSRIRVDVQIRPFCPTGPQSCFCESEYSCDNPRALGAAGPARQIPLIDSDGVVRLYPQALAKQWDLPDVAWSDVDIIAQFNGNQAFYGANSSNGEASAASGYWLPGDPIPQPGQQVSDLLSTVVHELLHGLGFASRWVQEETRAGAVLLVPPVTNNLGQGAIVEAAFDRHLVVAANYTQSGSPSPLTNVSAQLNRLLFDESATDADLFRLLGPYGELATAPRSLAFQANPGVSLFLETSLNPYRQGSSISHLDFRTYANSSDWLMVYRDVAGGTMSQIIAQRNGLLSGQELYDADALSRIDLRQGIGGQTRALMQAIGWDLRDDNDVNLPAPTSVSADFSIQASPAILSDTVAPIRRTAMPVRRRVALGPLL